MITLYFRIDLYSGNAVDAAVKAFAAHARAELEERPDAWVVRLEATGDENEQLLADELSNYVLGATIERRGD